MNDRAIQRATDCFFFFFFGRIAYVYVCVYRVIYIYTLSIIFLALPCAYVCVYVCMYTCAYVCNVSM